MAWSDKSGNVILWDVTGRRRVAVLNGESGGVSLSFSPDGRRLAVATDAPQGRIILRDATGPPHAILWETGGGYWADPIFSPDGRWLAIRSSSGIALWDLSTQELSTTLPRHYDMAGFSPDSRLLAASVGPGEVAIWTVDPPTRLATLDIGGEGESKALRFSPDNQMLAATGEDGVTLQRFDADWAAQHICHIVGRDPTVEEWSTFVPGRDYEKTCT
jgi:WD40 repeat protein